MERQSQGIGITGDWINEIFDLEYKYKTSGLDAVIQRLVDTPILTYEEEKKELIRSGKDNPDWCTQIE